MLREISVLDLNWTGENINGKRAGWDNNDLSKVRRYENIWLRYEAE